MLFALLVFCQSSVLPEPAVNFDRDIFPILSKHCVGCHGGKKPKGGLDLSHGASALAGGNSGPALVAHQPDKSLLLRVLTGQEANLSMPPESTPKREKLSAREIALIRSWIQSGGSWPGATDKPSGSDWWSLKPLAKVSVPGPGNPIDAFLQKALTTKGISFAPEADKRTLLRRLAIDLTGLVPTHKEMEAYLNDSSPNAYEKQVDRLLASIHRAERMARFWMDLAHFGDTHGFDKDQPRPNAWPYRDYLIRAFQSDRPLNRFIGEQVAGDALYPGTRDGIEALGFLAAGPWDFIGHAEVPETKLDGRVARHLDRDDMVGTVINTFMGITVQCAQCHNHKFDPIRQEDYYRLQAVFAAVDRADRVYHANPLVEKEYASLLKEKFKLEARLAALPGGSKADLEAKLHSLGLPAPGKSEAFGFHTAVYGTANHPEWIKIDLGKVTSLERVVIWPCHDDFGNIGAGFGFPTALKVYLDSTLLFESGDLPKPGFEPLILPTKGAMGQVLRLEISRLSPRQGDFMAALAEVEAFDLSGTNRALRIVPSTSSTIEAPPRWSRLNLTDGIKYEAKPAILNQMVAVRESIQKEASRPANTAVDAQRRDAVALQNENNAKLALIPAPSKVFAATIHNGSGAFKGTGANGGKPRQIFLLQRGNVAKPLTEVLPGAIPSVGHANADFTKAVGDQERRVALAQWISHPDNPLTGRVFVNRVWRLHMGRGIVETPSDFGKMGMAPSHPELLDWLAGWFQNNGQSPRALSRLIVTSRSYKQVAHASPSTLEADPANLLFSRYRRHRLDAETYRDSLLLLSGNLKADPFGPPFKDFVVEKPEHSPHYLYEKSDPADKATHRRAIYRFVVRSQQHPFLTTLDTADPSLMTDKRNETIGPLQALAMWNNPYVLEMSRGLATQLAKGLNPVGKTDYDALAVRVFQTVLLRDPSVAERLEWARFIRDQGLESAARVGFNLGEFVFVE